jgi:hypothetical protein
MRGPSWFQLDFAGRPGPAIASTTGDEFHRGRGRMAARARSFRRKQAWPPGGPRGHERCGSPGLTVTGHLDRRQLMLRASAGFPERWRRRQTQMSDFRA